MRPLTHKIPLIALFLLLVSPVYALELLPRPEPNQARFTTTVKEVDYSRKLITASTSTLIQPDGTELFYGTAPEHVFTIDAVTPIHYLNNPSRWISLRELKPGTSLAVYGRPNGNSILADRILINSNDPQTIRQTAVYPPEQNPVEYDKVCLDHVVVPMVFPITGRANYSDSFLASRGGGTRRHHGQDLMSPKLTPAVACFDGIVTINVGLGNAGNTITIEGDNGWNAEYYHMNNDSPGTDDAKGTADYCFAPGLKNGDRVTAGQLIGWVGDSGNAEGTGPHIHFEIWSQATNAVYNAYPSLRAAKRLEAPLVYAPAPDLVIPKGHGRYEGVIKKIDRDRKVLVLDLIALDTNGKGLQSITKPTREYLVVDDKSLFRIFGLTETLSFDNILPGDRISTIAKITPPGKGQQLRELFALRNLNAQMTAQIQPPVAEKTIPPENNGTILLGPQDDFLGNLAKTILEQINPLRAERNLPPLTFDIKLARAAQEWTVNMVDGDFYDLRDERINLTLTDFATRTGSPGDSIGFIFNAPNINAIADQLKKSYLADLLSPDAHSIGLGHTYLDEDTGKITHKNYWALLISR